MKKLLILLLIASSGAFAAGGSSNLESAGTNIRSKESLRNGAKLYMNYCVSCHSLEFQRYSRMAKDLNLTEDEVKKNLIFTDSKFTDHIKTNMDDDQATKWFGQTPPDLTVIAKARSLDWLYTYLMSFYKDDSSATGWNNTVLKNASMPNVLWELQGIQSAEFDTDEKFVKFAPLSEGNQSSGEFKNSVRDIVNFLDYTAEPAKLIRMAYAPWVLIFLSFFAFMAYLLKVNYFKDIH